MCNELEQLFMANMLYRLWVGFKFAVKSRVLQSRV